MHKIIGKGLGEIDCKRMYLPGIVKCDTEWEVKVNFKVELELV